MAIKIGGVFVDFEARTLKFEQGVTSMDKSLKRFLGTTDKGKGKVKSFGLSIDGVGSQMARLAAGYLSIQGVIRGVNRVLDDTSKFQIWRAQLETATESVAHANAKLDELLKLSFKSPSGVDQFVKGFTRLRNLGLKPTQADLISFGNTAVATGKRLDQMIEAVADSTTFEFERLKEFGLRARQTTDSIKFRFRGVTTEIEKNADAVYNYLRKIGSTYFEGAMEKRAKSLGTAFSNFGTAVTNLTAKLSEESGLANAIATVTLKMTDLINVMSGLNGGSDDLVEILFKIDEVQEKIRKLASQGYTETGWSDQLQDLMKEFDQMMLVTDSVAVYSERLASARKELIKIEEEYVRLSSKGANAAADEQMEKYNRLIKEIEHLESIMRVWSSANWTKEGEELPFKNEVLRKNIFNFSKINDALGRLNDKAKATFGGGMFEAVDKFFEKLEEVAEQQEKLISKNERFRQGLMETFAEGIARAEDFGDVLTSVLEEIRVEIIKTMLLGQKDEAGKRAGGILGAIFGNIGKGKGEGTSTNKEGFWQGLGTVLGGIMGFADGGRPPKDRPSLVGERGKELFWPDSAGTIVPNNKLGGSNIVFNISIDASGADQMTIQKLVSSLPAMMDERIVPTVKNALNRGELRI